jgi:DNA ligase-1
MKLLPNKHVRETIQAHPELFDVDGELMTGTTFQHCQSAFLSHGGKPDFTYHVFDVPTREDGPEFSFRARHTDLKSRRLPDFCVRVQQKLIYTVEELHAYYALMLSRGYEGLILRSPHGKYKLGRSTIREQIMLKLKPMGDSEAIIIGFEEQLHNTNEATINELGRSKRSSKKEGMVGASTLGKFLVKGVGHPFEGQEFSIGTGRGLDQSLRQQVWNNQQAYIGKLIKFKYQEMGSLNKPRIPIFLGFRSPLDM